MPEYTVTFTAETSAVVTVNADDPDDAIERATEHLPGSLCHQCAGYRREYSRDEGDFEPVTVVDESGDEVWTATLPATEEPTP